MSVGQPFGPGANLSFFPVFIESAGNCLIVNVDSIIKSDESACLDS